MAEKVTEMKLTVDLQCPCCHKKVKKILCKFPQIRDQEYDEKNNIVRIIVVCCSPEKIRDKLCCEGGKVIKSIEIVKPKPPPSNEPKVEPTKVPQVPVSTDPPPERVAVSVQALPIGVCCAQCYLGYPGGPCYQGYGRPVPPPCYCYPYAHGYNMVCYVNRCDQYFSDENPSACSIM